MDIDIHPSWQNILQSELKAPYFRGLMEFVAQEYATYRCYPREDRIFAALDHCPWEKTKVVIIGQDPYHGPGQANGLCFSVNDGIPHPPSLSNIFKEIHSDQGMPYPKSGNLQPWADQGVLLLNATLTVRDGEAGSHQKRGWEIFTDTIIKKLSQKKKGLVFLLWGGHAKKKVPLIDTRNHFILGSGHPSPLSANRGYWFGNKHFSKTNELLVGQGLRPIDWLTVH